MRWVCMTVSDEPFVELESVFGPSVSETSSGVLAADGTTTMYRNTNVHWSWRFGDGDIRGGFRDELLMPLFACCLSGTPRPAPRLAEDPEAGYQSPAPVAVARLTRVGDDVDVQPVWALERPWLDGIRVLGEHDVCLTAEQAEAQRAAFVDERVLPLARETFATRPQVRSAALLVAQYWDDDADDEVHLELLWSEFPTPAVGPDDVGTDSDGYSLARSHNLPSGVFQDESRYQIVSNNGYLRPVALFAAYCLGGVTQMDDDLGRVAQVNAVTCGMVRVCHVMRCSPRISGLG